MLAATHMTNKHIRYIYKFPINAISIRMTPETVTFLWYYFLKTKTSKQNKQNLVNTMLKITTGPELSPVKDYIVLHSIK